MSASRREGSGRRHAGRIGPVGAGARFPSREADGSFRVRAVLSGPTRLGPQLDLWLARWVEENPSWELFGETHALSACFAERPQTGATDELSVLFVGAPAAPKFWKDWAARILRSAQEHLPEIGNLLRFENA